MELIIGIKNAAEFLKCGERTIHRLVERASQAKQWDETLFPKPFQEKLQKNGILRIWRAEDLKKFSPRKRGERIDK
jgi:hypothetical protein